MTGKILSNSTLMMVLFALVLVVASILLLNCFYQPTMDGIDWREDSYIVQPGDTLWGISRDYCPENVDCREWIEEVQILNDIQGGVIYPGQRITVLVPNMEG